jgi:hypothetical protein
MVKHVVILALLLAIAGGLSAQTDSTVQQNYKFLLVKENGTGISVQTGKNNGIRANDLLSVVKMKFPAPIYSNLSFTIQQNLNDAVFFKSEDGKFTEEMIGFFSGLRQFSTFKIIEIKAWNDPDKKVAFPDISIRVI